MCKILRNCLNYLIIVLSASAISLPAEGRTTKYSLKVESNSAEEEEMTRGSFMVASHCPDCNKGYNISQIEFTGYDKAQTSAVETFFITNRTDRTMSGVSLYIDYRDSEGRQLHKKFVKLNCNIPPGETRMAEIQSWDKQKRFHFINSPAAKRGGVPYTVTFDPVAYYLRF